MKKILLVKTMILVVKEVAKEYGFEFKSEEYGKAFKDTFWKDILKDVSNIPNLIFKDKNGNDYYIELRSFWGIPEIDIRIKNALLVLNYSDYDWELGKHTGKNFKVNQIRVEGYNYNENLKTIYNLIEKIEKTYKELEKEENKKILNKN